MSKLIALVGLAVIPFIAVAGHDLRELQLVLAIGIALISALAWLNENGIKRVSNTPALIFMGYLWLATMLAPKPGLSIGGMDIGYFWCWKPLFFITVMFLFINSIGSWRLKEIDCKRIINLITWAGTVMSIFVLLQAIKLDQFFVADPTAMPHAQWRVAGTIGHPSFVGTWLAITAPFALAFRNKTRFFIIAIATMVTMSMVAIGSLFVGLGVYWAIKSRQRAIMCVLGGILVASMLTFVWVKFPQTQSHLTASGRIPHWVMIVEDINSNLPGMNTKYPITGRGLGSFYYVFHTEHGNRFFQAHNEYLELAYNTGIAGFLLFLWALFRLLKPYMKFGQSRYRRILLGSFVVSLTSAGALFVWQLGPHIYYVAFLAGLLISADQS